MENSKIIESGTVFSKIETNNESNVHFLQNNPTFNTLIPVSFNSSKHLWNVSLFFFFFFFLVWSFVEVFFLMSSTFSNLSLEMDFPFRKQEKVAQNKVLWVKNFQYLTNLTKNCRSKSIENWHWFITTTVYASKNHYCISLPNNGKFNMWSIIRRFISVRMSKDKYWINSTFLLRHKNIEFYY